MGRAPNHIQQPAEQVGGISLEESDTYHIAINLQQIHSCHILLQLYVLSSFGHQHESLYRSLLGKKQSSVVWMQPKALSTRAGMPVGHYQLFRFSLASEAVLPDNHIVPALCIGRGYGKCLPDGHARSCGQGFIGKKVVIFFSHRKSVWRWNC